jgi:hypothetical protein
MVYRGKTCESVPEASLKGWTASDLYNLAHSSSVSYIDNFRDGEEAGQLENWRIGLAAADLCSILTR